MLFFEGFFDRGKGSFWIGVGAGPRKTKCVLININCTCFSIIFPWKYKYIYIPDGAPTRGSAPVDDADVIGDGIRGIDVVLDEVVEVEFVGLDVDWLVVWVDWLSIN